MDVVVTSLNGVIKVGVLSESLLREKDSHQALDMIREWESNYIHFIHEGKELLKIDADSLNTKWKVANLIYNFVNKNKNIRFSEFDKSISRDLGLVPTEKRKVGPAANDVNALIGFRTLFENYTELDKRFSWELIYFTYPLLIAYMKKKNITSFRLKQEQMADEIILIANNEAKFAVKGNSVHAIALTKRLIRAILSI